MVGHLVSLKWQYVLAAFRRSIWALIGLIFAALYAGGMLFGLGSAYFIANSEVPEYRSARNPPGRRGYCARLGYCPHFL